jgi:oxygen-dependent protoporphyrinogen oxidase
MIGIVGAGLTGLALAHELAKRGIEHAVFEAEDRPGGVIRSGRVAGTLLEFGPQRLRMTAPLAALVAELGLEREVVRAPEGLPLRVYAAGRLREAPFSLRALLTGDLLSWRGKLRVAAEPLTAPPRDDERVAGLLTRKLGREAYERLAGPLYGGLYASDPADMVVGLSARALLDELGVRRSLLRAFPRRGGRISPPPAFSFREGIQVLTDALHAARRDAVRLATPVRGLRRSGARWAIALDGGEVAAEVVVLTCEAAAAARLLAAAAPDAAARLARLVYNPLAVVHLHCEADLRGLGYQVGLAEDLVTRGVTWNGCLFAGAGGTPSRDGVCTAFLGGARHPWVVAEPDDRLGAIAATEFRRVTGHGARVLSVARATMPAWDLSWRALVGLELSPGIRVAAGWRSRPGIPGRLAEARRLADELST